MIKNYARKIIIAIIIFYIYYYYYYREYTNALSVLHCKYISLTLTAIVKYDIVRYIDFFTEKYEITCAITYLILKAANGMILEY